MELGMITIFSFILSMTSITAIAQAGQQVDPIDVSKQACSRDLSCWGKLNHPYYVYGCQQEIQKTAKNSFKWTGGSGGIEITEIAWLDYNKSTITIKGENFETLEDVGVFQDSHGKVAYQHGAGVYKKVSFECDYDGELKKVLSVRLIVLDR